MEEYFSTTGATTVGRSRDALEDVLTRPTLPVHVLLGIRDDALADLDAFKRRVPGPVRQRPPARPPRPRGGARRDRRPAASVTPSSGGPQVAAEPAARRGRRSTRSRRAGSSGISPGRGLVEERERGAPRRGAVPAARAGAALGGRARSAARRVLRAATLEELGGAEPDRRGASRACARGPRRRGARSRRAALPSARDASGTKIAHAVDDLAATRRVDRRGSRMCCARSRTQRDRAARPRPRRRRPPRYEIFHDVLAAAVLAWRARHEAERALAQERAEARRRQRRLLAVAVGALTALTLVGALAAYALVQRADARDRARAAKARELTSRLAFCTRKRSGAGVAARGRGEQSRANPRGRSGAPRRAAALQRHRHSCVRPAGAGGRSLRRRRYSGDE